MDNLPPGSHFCVFYRSGEELADVLISYVQAGLENNEYCLCIASGPLDAEKLLEAMRERIAGFDDHWKKGQVEVLPHTGWYVRNGVMDLDAVLAGWIEKLRQALDKGYNGLRASGNVGWLEKADWDRFLEYERKVGRAIGGNKITAMCAYSLDKCGMDEILDATGTHHFALIRRGGKWKVFENVEAREANKALYEREAFLNNVFGCIQDGISVLDKGLNILRVNPAMEKWYGGGIVGKKCYEAYHGRREPCETCPTIRAFKERSMQKDIVHDLGGWREVYAFPMVDDGGEVTSVIEHVRDINERKRAEDASRDRQNEIRAFFDGLPGYAFMKDKDGRTLMINKKFCDDLGFSHDWPIGKTNLDLFPGDLAEKYTRGDRRVFETGEPLYVEEEALVRGRRITVATRKIPIKDEKGRVTGLIGLGFDISELKRAEKALKESEEKYRFLVENSKDIIWKIDMHGRWTFISGNVEKVTGLRADEVVGKTIWDILAPECHELVRDKLRRRLRGEDIPPYEIYVVARDGHYTPFESQSTPILDKNGKVVGVQGISRDITGRKQAERELRSAKAQAELYVDLMSHDINNMNQVSLGFLELALDTLGLDENGRAVILKSMGALENSSRLIDKVRKLQKARSGELSTHEIDVGRTLGEVCAYYSGIRAGDVAIRYEPVRGYRVMANELLYDVFSNIVDNAIKHANGRPAIDIKLIEADHGPNGECGETFYRVSVEDNGQGVPDEMKARIFDRFRRGDTRAKGKGLGLYLAKTLVESYGGRIRVEDRVPGDHTKGSRFVVLLPALLEAPGERRDHPLQVS